MKKGIFRTILSVVLATVCLTATFALSACGDSEKNILVISRDASSGTRDAFDGLIKNSEGASLKKDKNGNEYTESVLVSTAEILQKTGDVITKVSATKTAIGYISLGSVNDTIKVLKVDGVEATSDNVLNGTYKLKRPFVIATNKAATKTAATEDFLKYLSSSQAQLIVTANGYVEQASTKTYSAPADTLLGSIVIKGSSSVDPLMDKFIADYKKIGGSKVSSIAFEKDAQGSSFGVSAAKADTAGNVIGMSSSALKEADKTSLDDITVALDAVAIIVYKDNDLTNITVEQLFDVYTGTITKFSEIK